MNQEKLTKILKIIIKIGIISILFLPIVLSAKLFFPFVVLRNFLFRFLVELIFVFYIILALNNPYYRPNFKNKLIKAVLIFFAVLFFASLFGIDFKGSIWGNYERMNGLFHSLHLVLYFIVLASVFKEKEDWNHFFTFSIFISLVISFIGLGQHLGVPFLLQSAGGERLSGTLGNAVYLAAYLIFHLFLIYYFFIKNKFFSLKFFVYSLLTLDASLIILDIFSPASAGAPGVLASIFKYPNLFLPFLFLQAFAFYLFFFKEKRDIFFKIFLGFIFLFEFFIFFNTQTRGALLGLLLGVLILILFKIILGQKKEKVFSSLFILLILGFSLFIYINRNAKWIENIRPLYRLTTISPKSITGESRILTWKASWRGWLEKPFLGYGPENYYIVFNKYFPSDIYKDAGSQIWFDKAHNIIFDIGVTSGFIGLISYLSIFAIAIYYLIRIFKGNNDFNGSLLFIALLISYLGQNLFVFDTLNTEILFYLILAFIVYQNEINIPIKQEIKSDKEFNFIIPVVLFLTFLFIFYNLNYKELKGNYYLAKGLRLKAAKEQQGQTIYDKDIIEYFKKALSYNQFTVGRFETRQQLASYAIDLVKDDRITKDEMSEVVTFAVSEMEKTINENPNNAREDLFLATLYDASAKIDVNYLDKSIKLLDQAVLLSPTRPQIYFERGQAKIFQGRLEEGIEDFKKGVENSPKVIDSRWNLAAAYILVGQEDKAAEEFKTMETLGFKFDSVTNYQRLIQLYLNKKDYQKIAELYEKIIKLDPNNASYYAKLAWAYMMAGDKENAKEATKKAVELNPDLKDQADLFIKQLGE